MSDDAKVPGLNCPSCGKVNAAQLAFCGHCGAPMSIALINSATSLAIVEKPLKRVSKAKKPGRFITWSFEEGELARKLLPEEILEASTSGSKGYIVPDGLYSLVFEEGVLISESGPGKYSFLSEEDEKKLSEVYTRRTDGVINSIGNSGRAIKKFLLGVSPQDIEEEKLKDYDYLLNHIASNRSLSMVIARTSPFIVKQALNAIEAKDTRIDVSISLQVTITDIKLLYEELLFDRLMISISQLQGMLFEADNGVGGYFTQLIQSFRKYPLEELQKFDAIKQSLLASLKQYCPSYLEIKDIISCSISKTREVEYNQPQLIAPKIEESSATAEVKQLQEPKQVSESINVVEQPTQTPVAEVNILDPNNSAQSKDPEINPIEFLFHKGLACEKGDGVPLDIPLALEWYRQAADLGHEEAHAKVLLLQPVHPTGVVKEYPGYTSESLDLLKKAHDGDSAAQFKIGLRYSNGKGVPKDSKEAVSWYLKSAEQGEPAAMNNLALKYKSGDGVAKNITEAFKWCLKSANKGFGIAQFNLADFYEKGIGVDADQTIAIDWLKKAAAQGEKDSILKLKKLGATPKPVFQNYLDQAKSAFN